MQDVLSVFVRFAFSQMKVCLIDITVNKQQLTNHLH